MKNSLILRASTQDEKEAIFSFRNKLKAERAGKELFGDDNGKSETHYAAYDQMKKIAAVVTVTPLDDANLADQIKHYPGMETFLKVFEASSAAFFHKLMKNRMFAKPLFFGIS